MERQSEYKKKFNPETGKFTREHIYGEGFLTDTLKSIGKKVISNTAKKATVAAATKTGKHIGKKAGDKIVSLLSKEKPPAKKTTSQYNRNARVNSILSGGKII